MKISIVRPCAIITVPSGGATKRLVTGMELEGSDDWELRAMQSLVKSGHAIEIGGNQQPEETKKETPRKPRAKKADESDEAKLEE